MTERERDRDRERHRGRDRQRQTKRERETQRDRQTGRPTDRHLQRAARHHQWRSPLFSWLPPAAVHSSSSLSAGFASEFPSSVCTPWWCWKPNTETHFHVTVHSKFDQSCHYYFSTAKTGSYANPGESLLLVRNCPQWDDPSTVETLFRTHPFKENGSLSMCSVQQVETFK